ncbi:hypothetical protein [Magnetococcus marinus]|uniref:hypothetical protein n=1 Tax=Magnetococcus marinus TaxID=1124597 RepID=UPI00003C57A0|nr:hypothetical protein [Magnetococcus marinus]
MAISAAASALPTTGGVGAAKLSIATVAKAQFIKEAGLGLGMGLGLGAWLALGLSVAAWIAWRKMVQSQA